MRPDAGRRVDGEGRDLLGCRVGDLLDVHAALGGGDHGDAAGFAVDQQREVELTRDGRALLDIETPDLAALGSGLVGDQGHAQHLGRFFAQGVDRLDHLDPAALAAAAGMDLSLEHPNRPAQLLRRRDRLVDAVRLMPPRHRHAVLGENGLGLVFVDVHGWASCARSRRCYRVGVGSGATEWRDGSRKV